MCAHLLQDGGESYVTEVSTKEKIKAAGKDAATGAIKEQAVGFGESR